VRGDLPVDFLCAPVGRLYLVRLAGVVLHGSAGQHAAVCRHRRLLCMAHAPARPCASGRGRGARMRGRSFFRRLLRYYTLYTIGFIVFLFAVAVLEHEGFPRAWIGYVFMFSTIVVYAAIGIISRTSDMQEYYVAGRRVPSFFNGMATAADWISAASFISLAGGLYLWGFDGLAYIMGWTGGFVLVALLIAPYLRKFGQYTIPDYLASRYTGPYSDNVVRIVAVV